jgi:cytochrome c
MQIKRLILGVALLLLASCEGQLKQNPVAEGDLHRGSAAIYRYGCGSCHTIAKLKYAHGLVGPPLTNMNARMFVAGTLPNTPGDLMQWIRNPQQVKPGTAMPNLDVTPQDAADIAAYLYAY